MLQVGGVEIHSEDKIGIKCPINLPMYNHKLIHTSFFPTSAYYVVRKMQSGKKGVVPFLSHLLKVYRLCGGLSDL